MVLIVTLLVFFRVLIIVWGFSLFLRVFFILFFIVVSRLRSFFGFRVL